LRVTGDSREENSCGVPEHPAYVTPIVLTVIERIDQAGARLGSVESSECDCGARLVCCHVVIDEMLNIQLRVDLPGADAPVCPLSLTADIGATL
jgi:hypothetical protein